MYKLVNAKANINMNHAAFLKYYEPIHAPFVRYCSTKAFGIMSAEDLVQEAVLESLEAFDKIKNKEKLLSYMIGIVNNKLKNYLRRKKFTGNWDEKMLLKIEAKIKNPTLALDIQFLYKCIEKLKPELAEAIQLYELSGFNIKEISVIQNSSPGAVKTRLYRARKELKKMLHEDLSPRSLSQRLALFASILF